MFSINKKQLTHSLKGIVLCCFLVKKISSLQAGYKKYARFLQFLKGYLLKKREITENLLVSESNEIIYIC